MKIPAEPFAVSSGGKEVFSSSGRTAVYWITQFKQRGEMMKKSTREILKPDFSHLVLSIASTALLKMGLDSRSKEEEDRNMARYNIDLLSVLREKTKNNLTKEEAGLLDSCVQDLQLKFVQTERGASSKDSSEEHFQGKASKEPSSEGHFQGKASKEPSSEGHFQGKASGEPSSEGHFQGKASGEPSSEGHFQGKASKEPSSEGHFQGKASGEPSSEGHFQGKASKESSSEGHFQGKASGEPSSEGHFQGKASKESSSENPLQNKDSEEVQEAERRLSEAGLKNQTGAVSGAQTTKHSSGEGKA